MKALQRCFAVAAAVVAAGCGSTPSPSATSAVNTSPTPSVSPSPTCSPFGATPRPCSPAEFGNTQRQNELIAEAEQTYQKFWNEDVRLYRVGGTKEATQPFLDTLTGNALKSAVEVHRDLKSNKTKAEGGTFDILSITPKPTRTKDGSVMSLSICWRTKGVEFRLAGKTLVRNSTVREESYFRTVDDSLRIFLFESRKVSKC